MMEINPKLADTTLLAYIGDAVYELYIRLHVIESDIHSVNKMNRKAIEHVCADSQARIAKNLMKGFLSDEEVKLLKRARNNTKTPKPRGSSQTDYKLATGFEALIGYLYLNEDFGRLKEVIDRAVELVEEESGGGSH